MNDTSPDPRPVLVLGGTGTSGRRVARRIAAAGCPVRIGSRRAGPAFDWSEPATWGPVLDGTRAAYLAFAPDLAVPGAPGAVAALAGLARERGLERLVLLSGRGEEQAQRAEEAVRAAGAPVPVTVVRASFFMQDFDEKFLVEDVRAGLVRLPVDELVREPFVDVEDVADVAAAALLDERHAGATYEVTGPQLLSFPEALERISTATGRAVRYERVPAQQHAEELAAQGVPAEVVSLLRYLFTEVLDGRGQHLGDGVRRALGRPARPFEEYARRAAAGGAWDRCAS
ncbi:NmrA family NAD(P)-binding protein [Kineococcus gypseus]|uniref:NmrA family NAD(P)-binding protein n=1 Tax=Kineococcus gypseus TaxID=1637102 RepID=UPI003D7E98CF